MPLRLLLQENPRVLLLASESHALVFRHVPADAATGFDSISDLPRKSFAVPKCVVEFATLESLDLSNYRLFKAPGIHGTLGLISIEADIYLCVISAAVKVATVRPDEDVQKILSVEFCWCLSLFTTSRANSNSDCLTSNEYDHQLHDEINPYPTIYTSGDERSYNHGPDSYEPTTIHPCLELKRLLSGGTFYYSVDFDLTNRLQNR